MELLLWILLGLVVLFTLSAIAVVALVVFAFAFIVSGQLEKEDSDSR
jgi:hypothetical protein